LLSEEAKALQAYILREGLCHPDFLEDPKYRKIFTLLKWKYRKLQRLITKKTNMSLYKSLLRLGIDNYITELFSELNWDYLRTHDGICWSVFEGEHYYTMRALNFKNDGFSEDKKLDDLINEILY